MPGEAPGVRLPGERAGVRGEPERRSQQLVHDEREPDAVEESSAQAAGRKAVAERAVEYPRSDPHRPLQAGPAPLSLVVGKRWPGEPVREDLHGGDAAARPVLARARLGGFAVVEELERMVHRPPGEHPGERAQEQTLYAGRAEGRRQARSRLPAGGAADLRAYGHTVSRLQAATGLDAVRWGGSSPSGKNASAAEFMQ